MKNGSGPPNPGKPRGLEWGVDVKVLLFGPAAAAAGRDRVEVRVRASPTCADVTAALAAAEPRLAAIAAAGRLAVNHEFAAAGRVIEAGDEVALISLVSGG